MKIKKHFLNLLAGCLLVCVFQLNAADSTNNTTIQENWQTISNRWGSVSLEKIKQTAEKGDVSAQYYLAISYSNGDGVAKDESEAFKWMKSAAEQGLGRAQRKLGWMFQEGLGVETNLVEAVLWYQKASQRGDAQAQFNLGWMYEKGVSVSQDYAVSAKFYRLAAEQGDAMGQNNLGWLYKNGWGVPEDVIEAVKWFQKSAEQGDNLAAYNLAWIYASGTYGATNTFGQGAEAQVRSGGVAPNHELAEKWMQQAVDLSSAEGQFQFGDLLYGEFDNEGHQDTTRFFEAGEWYRKAAEQGLAKAQEKLAEMYYYGQLGDDQRSNCIPWFLKAAAQGNADAQAKIGELRQLYPNSELLKSINPIDSLKQAAMQGDLQAQFELARRYHAGDGVPKDSTESFKWMEMAAQHDISPVTWTIDAHYYLGVMYEKGDGVTKNLTNAYKLYLEAAVGGNKPDPFVRVGQMYENGEGVLQDDHLAAENYYNALQFGFAPTSHGDVARCTAIENLLNLYFDGRGLPDDKNVVSQQLDEIKRNHPITTAKAQFLFGEIYYQSQLVPKDLVEAAAWFHLAANQNLDDAVKKLQQVELEMSPAQKEAEKSRLDSLESRVEDAKEQNSRESCTDCLWW
jgi:TPR repeat protein